MAVFLISVAIKSHFYKPTKTVATLVFVQYFFSKIKLSKQNL